MINVNLTDIIESKLTPEELVELGGIPGPRGLTGEQGEQGPIGPTGNTIVPSVDEATGIMSFSEAPTGTIPAPVLVKGPQGEPGNNLEFTWNGTQLGVRQEGEVSYTYVDLKGAKGDTGLTGPKGDPGIPGVKGDPGDIGLTGPAGDPGDSAYEVAVANGFVGNQTQWLASLVGPQGEKGIKGDTGATGNDGRGITSVTRTSGTGVPGTLDTYTITYSDSTTSTFQVYNGADGEGAGDMLRSIYDPNNKNGDAFAMANMVEGTTQKILTATERTKLSGIADNANNYVHPTTAGNKHIPTGGASNQYLKYSADGTASWASLANNLTTTTAGTPLDATQGKALKDQVDAKATTTTYTGTLASASWTGSSAPYSQTITVTGMASTDNAVTDVALTGTYATDQAILTNFALVYRMVSGTNQVTAYATKIPTADIPLQFKVVR